MNWPTATAKLIEAKAVLRVADEIELGAALIRLFDREQERVAMGQAAQHVLQRERGAVARTVQIVEQVVAGQPVTL